VTVGTKAMPPILFSEITITDIMKFTHIIGTSFKKLRLFFHKVFFVINTRFPPLHEMPHASSVKFSATASKLLTHHVSAHCNLQNGVLGVHILGAKK
jgi:hypothetical protein